MKKYPGIIFVLLLSAGILSSCKKDSDSSSKKITESIKDKSWSGTIIYTGKPTEYYSVHFNADNTLEWAQISGKYTGHWVLNGTALTLTFDANTVEVKANISGDNRLTNITDNTSVYEITSGGLVAKPDISLENTVWKGTRTNTIAGTMLAYQMNFMTGNKVEIRIGNVLDGVYSYTREAAGAAFRTGKGIFGTIISDGEMMGSDVNAAIPWEAIKQ